MKIGIINHPPLTIILHKLNSGSAAWDSRRCQYYQIIHRFRFFDAKIMVLD